ncbi:MAG: carboxypeptidase regulatory-like domain-containing protein [Chlamydiae bacterium]|nr:carboxypeptidase regulatory-like domain-containing protein [Chlamydiota bacterium]MBI3266268.1 carboxypeptidase regulatory-like domain-containing protein [Chlamydiota bacterium]
MNLTFIAKIIYIFLIVSSLSIQGCGKKENENSSSQTPTSQNNKPTLSIDPQKTGTISGKVLFKGQALQPKELPMGGNPECSTFHQGKAYSEELLVKDGALQNVFIYIKEGLEQYSFTPPQEPVKLNQAKCLYSPHVVGVQVNQPFILVNSDPTLHNVHSYSQANETWNVGMPFEGMEVTKTFSKSEIMITLKCDLHPWMIGYVVVLNHPYFAVTDAQGHFEIKNLPPGKYVIEAWHEKLGTQDQTIEINAQETKELEFSFEFSSKK